jgi:ferredoxin
MTYVIEQRRSCSGLEIGVTVKIIPDNDVCGAHGACAMVDEELFNLDDDGFIAIGDSVVVPAGKEEIAQRGVDACPLRALRIN